MIVIPLVEIAKKAQIKLLFLCWSPCLFSMLTRHESKNRKEIERKEVCIGCQIVLSFPNTHHNKLRKKFHEQKRYKKERASN